MTDEGSRDAIAFVEKVLVLLDEGRVTATYKYAVLLALIDLCMERATADGCAPTRIPTRAIAAKVAELYWPHSAEFRGAGGAVVLRQNSSNQAAIVSLIDQYREGRGTRAAGTYGQARLGDRAGFERLLDGVEWKLIKDPLPRLQILGSGSDPFVYDIAWDTTVRRSQVRDGALDAAVYLKPGVGDHLIRINALLRPLIQHHWANLVAKFNRNAIEDSELEEFGVRGTADTDRQVAGRPPRPAGQSMPLLRAADAHVGGRRPLHPVGAPSRRRHPQPRARASDVQQPQA